MEHIHQILNQVSISSQREVLATILHVEGSSYRKAGTSMLLGEDETKVGLLSAGCLEADLAARLKDILNKGLPETVVYNMKSSDEISWGDTSGCNGVITVLLEPINPSLRNHLLTLKSYLDKGMAVTILKKLTNDYTLLDYYFAAENGDVFGSGSGEIFHHFKYAHSLIQESGLCFVSELSVHVYSHCFKPKPRLFIFGAGQDAVPLVKFSSQIGFAVSVSDWRPTLCTKGNFPDAEQLLVGFPREVVETVALTPFDSVIILTHHFQRDQELISLLMKQKLRYLGILGSRRRTARLLGDKEIPANVSAPVGLSIGAEGPEEIAISIVAELISIYRQNQTGKVRVL